MNTATPMQPERRKARVRLDGYPIYDAWVSPERWNGWMCPCFNRAAVEDMARLLAAEEGDSQYVLTFDAERGVWTGRWTAQTGNELYEDDFYEPTIIDGEPHWWIGAWAWCWWEIDDEPETFRGNLNMATNDYDFSDLLPSVPPLARLAAIVAAAGGHNLLLLGRPGTGKTMLARRLVQLLPDLEPDYGAEVLAIQRECGMALIDAKAPTRPPFRAPHHTVSVAGLLGGGTPLRPGEVSLAHRGVLFLDELPEFSRLCLDGVREPLHDGNVIFRRAATGSVVHRAKFLLVGSMTPCPCGYLGDSEKACVCPASVVARYVSRIAPLLRHFPMVVDMRDDRLAWVPDAWATEAQTTSDLRARIAGVRPFGHATVADTLEALGVSDPGTLAQILSGHELRGSLRLASGNKP